MSAYMNSEFAASEKYMFETSTVVYQLQGWAQKNITADCGITRDNQSETTLSNYLF